MIIATLRIVRENRSKAAYLFALSVLVLVASA